MTPLLTYRSDRGENPDIAIVPVAKEAARGQLGVTQSFSAEVSDGHAAAKMEERRVRTDRNSAGVQVAAPNYRAGRNPKKKVACAGLQGASRWGTHYLFAPEQRTKGAAERRAVRPLRGRRSLRGLCAPAAGILAPRASGRSFSCRSTHGGRLKLF
jgi:hypothetical protein